MVRFFKVNHLEEQRRVLVARSEIYRQTMQVETANVKFSLRLLKEQFGPLRVARNLLKLSAPLARFFLARKRPLANGGGGFMASVLYRVRLAAEIMPLFRKSPPAAAEETPAAEN